jgi:hypothetical protein
MTRPHLSTFICTLVDPGVPLNPRPDSPLTTVLRFTVEGLKAYYCEAITAQTDAVGGRSYGRYCFTMVR